MSNLHSPSDSVLSSSKKTDSTNAVTGQYVSMDNTIWYKIVNSHRMSSFFLTAISSGDHWMFVSSRGALTAGRQNPDSAMFPYYSADKIVDTAGCTGPKTFVRLLQDDGTSVLWEPFSAANSLASDCSQNLYKNWFGSRILFEEINHSLKLAFRYSWTFGEKFGFIRSCELVNLDDRPVQVELTDGLENLLPSGVGKDFQLRYSNLADAYKKSERLSDSSLGIFYLSSIPTDRAEPSEGLLATVAWQHGLDDPTVAISSVQVEEVRRGNGLTAESDIRGKRGAYFISKTLELPSLEPLRWKVIADVNYDHCDVIELHENIVGQNNVASQIEQDITAMEDNLLRIVSASDGRQVGDDRLRAQRHQSNVLFNVMRGGIPANGYRINVVDFCEHVRKANHGVAQRCENILSCLPDTLTMDELQQQVAVTEDADLIRITSEYLPLRFSRRHGDPTRPWNKFSIDLRAEDGTENLSYQGNWRDIFQNWEALSVAYPYFTINMILRFVNASTADGYNPYRITKDGFDWEVPDPDDPWANIGYWGDHQIVYLLRLLQRGQAMTPNRLDECLSGQRCAYANIPYRIRSHEAICRDPQDTIDFDSAGAAEIAQRVERIGGDGKLLWSVNDETVRVNLVEKLLVPALAKLSGFVPEGGIWLNTQRPEWNDANNALVGRGMSVVTACHLRRYLTFLIDWFSSGRDSIPESVLISQSVYQFADRIKQVLGDHADAFDGAINDSRRRQILDELAMAGSDYREGLYDRGIGDHAQEVSLSWLVDLFGRAVRMIDHTIRANRRDDGMYHSYNLLHLEPQIAPISHLYEMLEGQVAVLSSGLLSGSEVVDVLDALRRSKIYREDQQSYMLYPNRQLPRFLNKNLLPQKDAMRSRLLKKLTSENENSIVRQDVHGDFHFHGKFRNVADLNSSLDRLQSRAEYHELVCLERDLLNELFEKTFGHHQFTGRSGTFFGYEGLGSIYWHMVSKLALAVMEHCVNVHEDPEHRDSTMLRRLHTHYREIRDGIGLTKTPLHYGAFPSDPYSHTPEGGGVQQPGMTGQVKEDILSRWDEIGIRIDGGQLRFEPVFFEATEFLKSESVLDYFDVHGHRQQLPIPVGCFAFTLCQVPIVYRRNKLQQVVVHRVGDESIIRDDLVLLPSETDALFARRGEIRQIEVSFDPLLSE
ncbi:hypothetical protein [Aporhodopirellula aestuarii]|uniref:Cellobiose phosphorylase n=1 Tax=Aporhodopirellula aestuarii TaxID=2950107 RepID=A0ABT0U840_9BACT|nr:hypothetical protein [Aporhodopirellula aestuarii]MCM2373100.1 hypothetical protein [Aporhodopirellula aestuarii]